MKKCLEEVAFEASSQEWRHEFSWKTEAVFAVSSSAQGLGVRWGVGAVRKWGFYRKEVGDRLQNPGEKKKKKNPGEDWIPG